MTHQLFVYGSLKRNNNAGRSFNSGLLETRGCTFLGEVSKQLPLKMLSMGRFPTLVPTGDGSRSLIHGEMVEIDEKTLGVLDRIEGHPDFYQRVKYPDVLGDAWVYILPDTDRERWGRLDQQEVASGCW